MSDLTKEDLREILTEALHNYRTEEVKLTETDYDSIHREHHEFIQMEIDRRKRNQARWEKFQLSFIGGLALSILGFLGWIGALVISWIRHGGPPS